MVSDPRGTLSTRRIRRLNTPQTVSVREAESGEPRTVLIGQVWQAVLLSRRPWRIDQQWWRRKPVSRMYYRVAPEDGPPMTLFRDLSSGEWFRQE